MAKAQDQSKLFPNSVNKQIVRIRDLVNIVSLSKSTIYRMEKANEFPRRIRLTSGGSVGWTQDSITSWIEGRKTA